MIQGDAGRHAALVVRPCRRAVAGILLLLLQQLRDERLRRLVLESSLPKDAAEEVERLPLLAALLVHADTVRGREELRRAEVLRLDVDPEEQDRDEQRDHQYRLDRALVEGQDHGDRQQRHKHARDDPPDGRGPVLPEGLLLVHVHELVAIRQDHEPEREGHEERRDRRQDRVDHEDHEHEDNVREEELKLQERPRVAERAQPHPHRAALLLRERWAELAPGPRHSDVIRAQQLHAEPQKGLDEHVDNEGRGLSWEACGEHVLDSAPRLRDEPLELGEETPGDRGDEEDLHDHEHRELGKERRLDRRERHVPLQRREEL
mmetsp:Transcript_39356/g.116672  ORF Transcript_39356/g.116672 Transcript_39356/m.116672 type:complete len:319 (-) Transcript_39356:1422-2378(-)